jgi:hypothetical protein
MLRQLVHTFFSIVRAAPPVLFVHRNSFLINLNNTIMKKFYSRLLLLIVFFGASYVSKGQIYWVSLSGPNEVPANNSPWNREGLVTIDPVANTMRVQATFSGLLAGVTASHIHAPTAVAFTGTAGVATTTPTFTGFSIRSNFRNLRQHIQYALGFQL